MTEAVVEARPTRRWRLLTPGTVWLVLIVAAIWLDATRTGAPGRGGNRMFDPAEGFFYVWTIPALGIVWTMALALVARTTSFAGKLPADQSTGSRRSTKPSLRRVVIWGCVGVTLLYFLLGASVPAFNRAEVGGLNGMAGWLGHLILVAVGAGVVSFGARRGLRAPFAAAIGTVLVLFVGHFNYISEMPMDPGSTLPAIHGLERARWFVVNQYTEKPEHVVPGARVFMENHRPGGMFFVVLHDNGELAIEAWIPWSGVPPTIQERDALTAFWSSPDVRSFFHLPRSTWRATWAAPTALPSSAPSLRFTVSGQLEQWQWEPFAMTGVAQGRALADADWSDLLPVSRVLAAEHALPLRAGGPWTARDRNEVNLLRLAMELDSLAARCGGTRLSDLARSAKAIRGAVLIGSALPEDLARFGDIVRAAVQDEPCKVVQDEKALILGRLP
jgi:hypothetical protein